MADEAEVAEKKTDTGGKGKLLPMIGVAVAALLLGGGGSWFFFAPKGEEEAKPKSAEAAVEAKHGEEAAEEGGDEDKGEEAGGEHAPLSERLITLDPFVVNLDENGAKRFLRTKIELETATPADKAELQTRSAQMRDSIIVLLSSKRLEDLGGFEGKVILKNEIQRRLNDMLGEGEIHSVLITEFVIQ
jgi:flagellar FliL protein